MTLEFFFPYCSDLSQRISAYQLRSGNKLVVYTASFGGYDCLSGFVKKTAGVDWVVLSDDELTISNALTIRLSVDDCSPKMFAKYFKLFPNLFLGAYESSLWIDANIRINQKTIDLFINFSVSDVGMMLVEHNKRRCLYQEAKECIYWKKDDPDVIKAQVEKYAQQNYPKNYGLNNGGILFRKHNRKENIYTMGCWMEEISGGSARDQLSLNFVLWKTKALYTVIDKKKRAELFQFNPHAKFSKTSEVDISRMAKLRLVISAIKRRGWRHLFFWKGLKK